MASPQLLCMDSARKREPSRSHGLKARITISLLNLLGLRFWTHPTFCITRIAWRGCSSKWMRATLGGEHARIKWCTLGWDTLMRKAEEGKATLDRGRSFSEPAKRGLLLSLSSLSFIGSRWPGCWRWKDIGISLRPTSRQESLCTLTTSLDCMRTA